MFTSVSIIISMFVPVSAPVSACESVSVSVSTSASSSAFASTFASLSIFREKAREVMEQNGLYTVAIQNLRRFPERRAHLEEALRLYAAYLGERGEHKLAGVGCVCICMQIDESIECMYVYA